MPEIEKAFAYYLIDKKELVLVNDLSSKENPQAIAWDEKIVLQRW
ncbi:hypothetical protein J2128_001935 [Methanomicrobium sp. W14]|nr:hypothetical protein [Methanomicrobium sp. W14]MBP2133969.1 hypothetical protein [Methanomicrobium sp. W14]